MERRQFLQISSIATLGGFYSPLVPDAAAALEAALRDASSNPTTLAEDESFWLKIRKLYVTAPDLIDLDNANTAPTPAPVFDAYVRQGRRMQHAPSTSFDKMWTEVDKISKFEIAGFLGAKKENIAFTPNATYGLNTVLHGYPLYRGDEILITNHEYPDMVETILQRSKREGITVRVVDIPAPTESGLTLVDRMKKAVGQRTKLALISHVSAWSGEVLPVKEVCHAMRQLNVATLVDAAQSVGILDVHFDDIGCDFLSASLHKWLAGPIGTGVLIMKPQHIGKVWPLHPPSWDTKEYPMDLYEWTGTFNVAAYRATEDALRFHRMLGDQRKRARVRFLGDYWQQRVQMIPGAVILTPRDATRSFGVASFMLETVSAKKLAGLMSARGIVIQDKSGRHSPFRNALRVSPGVYATTQELDRFVAAVKEVARKA